MRQKDISPQTLRELRDQLNTLIFDGFGDATVLIYDVDTSEWQPVTHLTYGEYFDDSGKYVRLFPGEP